MVVEYTNQVFKTLSTLCVGDNMPNTKMPTKSCPFCGSTLLSKESRIPSWGSDLPEDTIVCNDCAATAPVYIWDLRGHVEIDQGR